MVMPVAWSVHASTDRHKIDPNANEHDAEYSKHTDLALLPFDAEASPHFAEEGTEFEDILGDWRPEECEGIK
jgi:hypothetical protein